MQLFENLVKCKDCMNNINNKCVLYKGKNIEEKDAGCYNGIDKNNKQIKVDMFNEYTRITKTNNR